MSGLQDFVVETEGRDTWTDLKDRAGIDRVTYSRMEDYPDEEFERMYGVLVEDYGMDGDTLQRTFGRYLFGEMAGLYANIYFQDTWGPIDMIHSVEETIHQSLKQRRGVEFTPPALETDRIGDDRVVIVYGSERKLCSFAKGLIDGIADYYDTGLDIAEPECMKDGHDRCRLVVTKVAETEAGASAPEPDTPRGTVQ